MHANPINLMVLFFTIRRTQNFPKRHSTICKLLLHTNLALDISQFISSTQPMTSSLIHKKKTPLLLLVILPFWFIHLHFPPTLFYNSLNINMMEVLTQRIISLLTGKQTQTHPQKNKTTKKPLTFSLMMSSSSLRERVVLASWVRSAF